MTDSEQREAARKFASKWMHGGDEKQDCHSFWIELLHDVMGVENVTDYIQFERPVKVLEGDGQAYSTRYIDGYIPEVKVLIEQKGSSHKLDVKEHQSGGDELTPFEQACRYNNYIGTENYARWIVTCNFTNLWIYDMNKPTEPPTKIETVELQQKYRVLNFLVNKKTKTLSHEMQVSIEAGNLVGKIYDAFYKQYKITDPTNDESTEDKAKREKKLHSLNELCVRLVFCLYAEDSDIFGKLNIFHDFLDSFETKDCRNALIRLFDILDTKESDRDEYLEPELAQFPYVNGGLFKDEIEIPPFTDEIKQLILVDASENFDWHDISPTIFGAVFESTLNPETRRSGGMHYTSIENIHKVIDPLFLDELKQEFNEICETKQAKKKNERLDAFQHKISSLKFLDPACGSGNFLTETYLSLRRLENNILQEKEKGQVSMVFEEQGINPIQVSIQQFYGIEINDFAATVAKTALWIAESQMLEETKSILIGFNEDFLPLKTYVNITEGNALRIDWNEVISSSDVNFIMGNPPYVGSSRTDSANNQKQDMNLVFGNLQHGKLDYVCGWFIKAADYISGTNIKVAFFSTDSIIHGEQVALLWRPLFEIKNIEVIFAYRPFYWKSEASDSANVVCTVIGFAEKRVVSKKYIFEDDNKIVAKHINGYIIDYPDFYIKSRTGNLFNMPKMIQGNKPWDGGYLIFKEKEASNFVSKYPSKSYLLKPFYGGDELLNGKKRYCLWLKGISPNEYKNIPEVMSRLKGVRESRLKTKTAAVRAQAETPYLFSQIRQPDSDYLAFPEVSTSSRRYIPIGFLSCNDIASNKLFIIPNATLYMFGILISNVHMSWMRVVAGRLGTGYSYSPSVYNNFPWPSISDERKRKIEQTAQAILDARALYPNASLSDLYDINTMPSELYNAHMNNNKAVMSAYGFSTKLSESECVAKLMDLYQNTVQN